MERLVHERAVLCWFVYFWRAIAANGLTFTHLVTLPWCGYARKYAWDLLLVRVLAMSIECARLVRADAVMMASIMSGAPLCMPGWAQHGMPLPFVFDVLYGVAVYEENTPSYELYKLCEDALHGRTTIHDPFFKGDPFLASKFECGLPAQSPVWFAAQQEYIHIRLSPDVFGELCAHYNSDLHTKLAHLCALATDTFWRVCHASKEQRNLEVPYNLHYSMFYVV